MSCNHLYDCQRCSALVDGLEMQAQLRAIPLNPVSTAPRDTSVITLVFPKSQKTGVFAYWSKSFGIWCGYYSGCDYMDDELLGWLPIPTLNDANQAVFG